MKNSVFLLVAILLSAILIFLQSCDAIGQDDGCESALCTKDYQYISIKLVYPDDQPVLLDSSKVFWVSQNRYLEQNTVSWNEAHVYGNYPIVNDGMQKELQNKEEMMCFTGYLKGEIVCKRDLLVGADCCHVQYLGAESLVQMIPYMETGKEISRPLDDEVFFHANVENADKYSHVVEVKFMGFDRRLDQDIELSRGIWKDGSFAIVLPETLNPNYLHALINNNGLQTTIIHTPPTMKISNRNAQIGNVGFWGVDKDGNVVTHFYPFIIDGDGYARKVIYTYADSDVTISGYADGEVAFCEYEADINANVWYIWKKTTTYSIEWKKGWNVWSFLSYKSVPERKMNEEWLTDPDSRLKWYGGGDTRELKYR